MNAYLLGNYAPVEHEITAEEAEAYEFVDEVTVEVETGFCDDDA